MTRLRPLLALLLSLSLIWASADQALAHAGIRGGIAVTLCDGTGQTRTLHLDANGNPAAPHDCSNCLTAQTQAVLPGPLPGLFARDAARVAAALSQPFPPRATPVLHQAQPRAPPCLLV